jgi:WD40 repeat protein
VPPYGDIHHRTETLRGIGDVQLTVLFPLGGHLQIGAGLSIPFGRTQPNPIVLGREGKTHEHIQFGSGTVDPLFSMLWSRPAGRFVLSAWADGQIPLYENRHGFKAPVTVRYSVGPSLPIGTTAVALQWAGQYQSIGRWDGEEDEGTGFHNGGFFLRATFLPWKGFRVSPGIYREVYSKSLSDESFRQGTTYSLTFSRFF